MCKCKHKPRFLSNIQTKLEEVTEEREESSFEDEEIGEENEEEQFIEEEPCICQKPEPKKVCTCLKGKDCTCLAECICGVQHPCLCEPEDNETNPEELPCKMDERKSICSCPIPKTCTCDIEHPGAICKCFPCVQVCTCGDRENCRCFKTCDCTDPCICDTAPVIPEGCICLKPKGKLDYASKCQCITESTVKQKKVRAGKEGYRWCHEINPKHTYFGYAYDRHDKIEFEEPKLDKFQIQGLHDVPEEDTCPVHGKKIPKFEKKPRKPSLDCCSAVGGTFNLFISNTITSWHSNANESWPIFFVNSVEFGYICIIS